MRKGAPLALVAGLFLILSAAAVVLVGIYVFLPSFLEESAARGIQNRLGLESTPELELEMGSLPEMLAGRFAGGRVTVKGVEFGGIRAERVVLDLDPLDLDLPASILQGAIESQKPLSGALRAEVSEEEISRL
ncbi:MAG: LmeA family phospholipid-binding protein, partial [Actinomycetota bacterium]|nr:LmeA family phospholipid-binding protein [Actinomycetota bacterium]